METPEPTTNDPFLAEWMEKFRSRFEPTDDIGQATHFYSTDEIHRAITSLNPGCQVPKKILFNVLKAEGYTWQIDDSRFSFDLKWQLRQVR